MKPSSGVKPSPKGKAAAKSKSKKPRKDGPAKGGKAPKNKKPKKPKATQADETTGEAPAKRRRRRKETWVASWVHGRQLQWLNMISTLIDI